MIVKLEECGSGFRYFLINFSDGGMKIAVKKLTSFPSCKSEIFGQ
jgi:c-di-GMP-binding flagellar brake protein YcgR